MSDRQAETLSLCLWDGANGLGLNLAAAPDSPVTIRGTDTGATPVAGPGQPLVEIIAVGQGRVRANQRNTATAVGARLRYVSHDVVDAGAWRVVTVDQRDEVTGLDVRSTLRVARSGASLQSSTILHNTGDADVLLQAVSSLMIGHPVGGGRLEDVDVLEGSGEWLGESRWTRTPVRAQDSLPWLNLPIHQHQDSRGTRAVVSHGTWSSGERIPVGALATGGDGPALVWQVEHNGPWRVELGERLDDRDGSVLVLGLFGPTDTDHGWLHRLAPGESFETVPVSVAGSGSGWQAALAEMTQHRRLLTAQIPTSVSVVFNDYMNTLMGDPTTEKLLPLIDAAAHVGADHFCIDAGWYDDGGDWWDSVGEWEPSTNRFPDGGLRRVVDHIRAAGLVPGLWLEPEVVGVRSPVADQLPAEAFLQRGGVRIVEHGRYLLDLRHDDAVKHLDTVVDRLVDDMGIGYFKLDYNVTPGAGTDREADSVGDGLLAHNRAHLAWIDAVLSRHPGLVVENCASGAMRADYAMLSRLTLQSTSDQQDPLLYPPIAAGALVSILPEQAANWAYPQPGMTDEEIVFTLCTGLAGQLYLSGRLDLMSPSQLDLVRTAVRLAGERQEWLRTAVPTWPLGLPSWDDPWVASALSTATETFVSVWWRGSGPREVELDLHPGTIDVAFPVALAEDGWAIERKPGGAVLIRVADDTPRARILRVRRHGAS